MNKFWKQSSPARVSFRVWRACARKKGFPTAEAAHQRGQEVYRCRHCGQWHRSGALGKLVAAVRSKRSFKP